ncbi:MAG: WYL domain-containing protein [Bacteroidales bacterium]|mgnify:CR=1 FL=1|nr:WYL domain-containing protein [Bacteroidales bacterium]
MSKREFLQRFNLIIAKVRKSPSTFKEIADLLAYESDKEGYNFTISKRTFIRDLEEIRSLYNIDIQYNFSKRAYEIDSEQSEVKDRILEAFDIFNTLNIGESLAGFIHFEKRKPQGTENLYGLLHAIKNKLQITFSYLKYWEEEIAIRHTEPLALKEFRNRWYLLAKDLKDSKVKSFALDRLNNLEISKKKFTKPTDFDVNELYKNCFGIIGPEEGQSVQDVLLSFTPFQGKYIKSLPLHESQEILKDNEQELLVKLKLYVTFDFVQELLSLGSNLKVISPDSLIEEMKSAYSSCLTQYSKKD